jgi:phenylpropionate dioxygenase-like ring-hydroxylating dioxygenase large terminal subunit
MARLRAQTKASKQRRTVKAKSKTRAKPRAKASPARILGTSSQIAQKLVPVGPKDPAGKLFRHYWIPIEVAADLGDKPKEVRILGEDLVLYRDLDGKPCLVGKVCAHRNASLALGTVEKAGIRCCYHGWLYDKTGQCIDQPCEPDRTALAKHIKIAGYPAEDRYGIIWAYMGEGEPPMIPPYDVFVRDDGKHWIKKSYHKCNWLQVAENMVDPQHTSFLHRFSPLTDVVAETPTLDKTDDTPYGFVVQSTREDQGHSRLDHFVLPAMNRVAVNHIHPPIEIAWFCTPVDETHAISITHRFLPDPPGATQEAIQARRDAQDKSDSQIPRSSPHETGSLVFAQDMWAMESQGPISNRFNENLANSDKGVIRMRRCMWEAIKQIEAGKDPLNTWRDARMNVLDFTTGIFHRGMEAFDPVKTRQKLEAQGKVTSGIPIGRPALGAE